MANKEFKVKHGLLVEGGGDLTVESDTHAAPSIKVDNSNNRVGIGISSPSTALEVIGDIKIKQGSGFGNYGLIDVSQAVMLLEAYSVNTSNYPSNIVFKTGSATRLFIDSDGKIGVGTTSPGELLEVKGDASFIEINHPTATSFSGMKFSEGGVPQGSIQNIGSTFSTVARRGNLEIFHNTGGDVTIQHPGGNVGIGVTNPDSKLQIANEDGSTYRFGFGGTSDVYFDADSVQFRTDNGGAVNAIIDTDGLKFNGDNAAVNALNDYEEGSWQPDNATGGGNMTAYSCRYTKIGNLVSIRFDILNSSGSGALLIGGLPYTVKTGAHGGIQIAYHNYSGSHSGFSTGYINAGTDEIRLTIDGSTGGWTLANGYRIIGFGAYETDL